jgi:hypothetical protein
LAERRLRRSLELHTRQSSLKKAMFIDRKMVQPRLAVRQYPASKYEPPRITRCAPS